MHLRKPCLEPRPGDHQGLPIIVRIIKNIKYNNDNSDNNNNNNTLDNAIK